MTKIRLSQDHQELLAALIAFHVKYLVVGGYAVGFHAEPRATKDLDIFIRADEENSIAAFKALASFGAPLAGFTPADFNDNKSIFHMGQPPERVDVLQQLDGITFDECWPRRVQANVNDQIIVDVIGARDLLRNKRSVGRLQDLADAEKVEQALIHHEPQ